MTEQESAGRPVADEGGTRRPNDIRALDGMSLSGLALVALLCVINAVRRNVMSLGAESVSSTWQGAIDWLATTAVLTWNGLLVALPVAFAVVATWNLAPPRPRLRYSLLALAVALSSLAGVALTGVADFFTYCPGDDSICLDAGSWVPYLLASWSRYALMSALFAAVFVYLRIADESAARARIADADRARFVQRMEEARLRMLQAQIEPHFLFNTLANVRRLYQVTPSDAATMLEHLMHYLETALPQMRADASTLAREAQLTRSYLALQRIRMGPRLSFDIEIPDALGGAALPPMMLVTLAENAIKHGVAPLPEGGHIGIRAGVDGDRMTLEVADTGRGFTHSSGGGTGLANIKVRLASQFGRSGSLTLAQNAPRGVVATIAVPFSLAAPAAVA